jgi:hypothetical protein
MGHRTSRGDRCAGYRQKREYFLFYNQNRHAWQEDSTATHRITPPLDTGFQDGRPARGHVCRDKIPVVYA